MNVQTAINMSLFLNFVYNNWNASSQSTNLDGRDVVDANGQPIIPTNNYKVLKTIYSNDLATDICPQRPTLEGYKTIGIVAQNTAEPTDIVIAIRGTEGVWEWVQDVKFLARPFPPVVGSGLTEDGFTVMYLSFSLIAGPSSTFMEDMKSLLPSDATVTITGHSLGASLATLLALDMSVNTNFPVTLYTLASPRTGDLIFHNLFNHVVPNTYRIHNRLDIVPKTPPPLLYFHVGDETELIPDKTMKFDLACEHHLTSYLNMLGALIGQAAQYPIDANCLKV
jgi:predicted lipase